MIINIDKSHPIFELQSYLKDISRFSVIELIKQKPSLLISDGGKFIIGGASEKLPIWIWTSDDITENSVNELCEDFVLRFKTKEKIKFAAKPSIASRIVTRFVNEKKPDIKIFHRQCLKCDQVLPYKKEDAIILHPDNNDITQIANCIMKYEYECYNRIITLEHSMNVADKSIKNPNFFIIKEEGKVITIARSVKETEVNKSIEGVYTIPECRNHGYAGAIVAYISKAILAQGKTAVLFTDIDNHASNKSYKNVGFIECGKLDEVELSYIS